MKLLSIVLFVLLLQTFPVALDPHITYGPQNYVVWNDTDYDFVGIFVEKDNGVYFIGTTQDTRYAIPSGGVDERQLINVGDTVVIVAYSGELQTVEKVRYGIIQYFPIITAP